MKREQAITMPLLPEDIHYTCGRQETLAIGLSEEAERAREGMSEPTNDTMLEWIAKTLAWMASGAVAGVAAAAAWFRAARERLHSRMTKLEGRMDMYTKAQAQHDTELAVIHTNQDHLSSRMDEVREIGLSSHRKLDEVLREVRRQ